MQKHKPNSKTHRPFYHYNNVIPISEVIEKACLIKTFKGDHYLNYSNGYCIKKYRNLDKCYVVDETTKQITLQLVPITSIFSDIKWVKNSSGHRIFARKSRNSNLVQFSWRRKDNL